MTWILLTLMTTCFFSWFLTVNYQAQLTDLYEEIGQQRIELITDMEIQGKEYMKLIEQLRKENDNLRRLLK